MFWRLLLGWKLLDVFSRLFEDDLVFCADRPAETCFFTIQAALRARTSRYIYIYIRIIYIYIHRERERGLSTLVKQY